MIGYWIWYTVIILRKVHYKSIFISKIVYIDKELGFGIAKLPYWLRLTRYYDNVMIELKTCVRRIKNYD